MLLIDREIVKEHGLPDLFSRIIVVNIQKVGSTVRIRSLSLIHVDRKDVALPPAVGKLISKLCSRYPERSRSLNEACISAPLQGMRIIEMTIGIQQFTWSWFRVGAGKGTYHASAAPGLAQAERLVAWIR